MNKTHFERDAPYQIHFTIKDIDIPICVSGALKQFWPDTVSVTRLSA